MDSPTTEPTGLTTESPKHPDRPEFESSSAVKKTPRVVYVLLLLLVIALVLGVGLWNLHNYVGHGTKTAGTTTATQAKARDPYAGWKTYSSSTETASFRYPNSWTVSKPYTASTNADQIGITSPSGAITISWVSDLGNFSNSRADYGSGTPEQAIIDKTAIPGAVGYQVVSGTTTVDGTTFHPWIAVQDSEGQLISTRVSNTVAFRGRHNLDQTTKEGAFILFSTSGTSTDKNTPTLTRDQAIAWFSSSEARQAKQVLLSFNDPQAPAQEVSIKEWGIMATVNTNFTLTYRIWPQNQNIAIFDSDQLTATNASCGNGGGGHIGKLKPNDLVYSPEVAPYTAEQFATEPQYQESRANIIKVGDYYYFYYRNQGPCADVGDLQQYTQDTVRSLLQSFRPAQHR